jgi:hypothetical protein
VPAIALRWPRPERNRCVNTLLLLCARCLFSTAPLVARGRIGSAGSKELRAYSLESATRYTLHSESGFDYSQGHRASVRPYQLLALKNVEILDLSGTAITDAAFERITAMSALKTVFVNSPHITPAAVERFRKARPNCRVIYTPKLKEVKSPEDTRLTG